jgi:hypothetical protein
LPTLGALTVLDGDPGQAKSTLAYDVAARTTTGRGMPHGDGAAAPAGVVLLQGEDDLAAGVVLSLDRLWRAADVGRVPLLEELARASADGDAAAALREGEL